MQRCSASEHDLPMKRASIAATALAFGLFAGRASGAFGQECPSASATGPNIQSEVRTLEGQLVFHDGIRQWFELKLDRPDCGQSSVQLVTIEGGSKALEILRECRVRSSGAIDFSTTGYYSLDTFQTVQKVEPIGTCRVQPPFDDTSGAKPDPRVDRYTVNMQVDYRPGDHPIVFQVRGAEGALRPWQAYASYRLTGGFALYGLCGEGFVVDAVFGTQAAKPGHFGDPRTPDDWATFDPETAAASGTWDLQLGYTCIRLPL